MPDHPARALHDPVLCLAPTLFRSLARGCRAEPLDLKYDHGSTRYAFRAPALLGCDDLRVLQGIVSLANAARGYVDPRRSSPGALLLRDGLALAGDAVDEEVLLLETSFATIAGAAGYGGGRGGAMGLQLRAGLQRLATTTVEFVGPDGAGSWRIIAMDELGRGRDRLRIVLNPRLGRCAKAEPRFVQIDMSEARRLGGDLARLLHQRLSGWIDLPRQTDPTAERRVRMSTLMEYAWGLHRGREPSPEALRQRRAKLKRALDELVEVGWRIRSAEEERGMLEIIRPAAVGSRRLAA